MDLSLANDNYIITIVDTNDSKTEISGFVVNSDVLATSLNTTKFHAKVWCNDVGSGTIDCPDTTTSTADDNISTTTLLQKPPS